VNHHAIAQTRSQGKENQLVSDASAGVASSASDLCCESAVSSPPDKVPAVADAGEPADSSDVTLCGVSDEATPAAACAAACAAATTDWGGGAAAYNARLRGAGDGPVATGAGGGIRAKSIIGEKPIGDPCGKGGDGPPWPGTGGGICRCKSKGDAPGGSWRCKSRGDAPGGRFGQNICCAIDGGPLAG